MSPTKSASSCGPSFKSWYWNVDSKSLKPLRGGLPGWLTWLQFSRKVTPKSSVIRLAKSTDTSSELAGGTSAVFVQDTVGIDISSATQGSSVAHVAGTERWPTKQCAAPMDGNCSVGRNTGAAARSRTRNMNVSA